MGRPLVMLRKYSGISSSESGVPWASSRTAVCSLMAALRRIFPDELHDMLDVSYRRVRNNAMSKVKDVPWASSGLIQNLPHTLADELRLGKERDWIEIALHGACVVDAA